MDRDVELYGKIFTALMKLEGCPEFAALVPEVRTNMVYAYEEASSPDDVLAIDGRITVVDGKPKAAGLPKFGASDHMARLIMELRKTDPNIRAGINFRNNPQLTIWLEKYCREKGHVFSAIDRAREPQEVIGKDKASMPWKIAEAVRAAGGKAPKIFYESAAPGKEPVSVLVGTDPIEVVDEMIEISKLWAQENTTMPKIGKIDLKVFEDFVKERLGSKNKNVLVPPLTGVDAGVVDIGNDNVMIIAEDPIFPAPGQPLSMFGWYTVHIGASDVAVMGVKPQYMTYSLLMPPDTPQESFREMIDSIHETARELDIAIVGGHTGYYPGLAYPIIGGVTVFSIAGKDEYVTPAGAKAGDDIIMTKGPAVETAGLLSYLYEDVLLSKHPEELVEKAKAMNKQMTVVPDCRVAMNAGGVTSMHDATEGGVIGGLYEIANASDVGMEVDENKFVYPDEIRIVCEELNIDPIEAIAEGTLLITCNPDSSMKIIEELNREGIESSIVGTVLADKAKRTIKRRDGSSRELEIPEQDPFWPAFFKGVSR